MSTDTQEAPVEERLAAFFDQSEEPAPENPEVENEEVEIEESAESNVEVEEAETEEKTEDEEVFTVKVDGQELQVTKDELLKGYSRQQDYTVKVMQVAEQRRAVEDRHQYLEAKEQLLGAAYEEAAEYRALQKQLEQFDALNWAQLAQQDMQQAYTLDLQRQELRRQLSQREKTLQEKVSQVDAARKMHLEKQMEIGRAEFQRRVGALRPEDVQATWTQGKALGYTEQELSTITDPRVMHAIYKAAKWDALQASKQATAPKVSKAPPVVKPGATKGADAQRNTKYVSARQALKKTGSVQDAVRAFLAKGG